MRSTDRLHYSSCKNYKLRALRKLKGQITLRLRALLPAAACLPPLRGSPPGSLLIATSGLRPMRRIRLSNAYTVSNRRQQLKSHALRRFSLRNTRACLKDRTHGFVALQLAAHERCCDPVADRERLSHMFSSPGRTTSQFGLQETWVIKIARRLPGGPARSKLFCLHHQAGSY